MIKKKKEEEQWVPPLSDFFVGLRKY